jgi:hypothetical protein
LACELPCKMRALFSEEILHEPPLKKDEQVGKWDGGIKNAGGDVAGVLILALDWVQDHHSALLHRDVQIQQASAVHRSPH